MSRLVCVQCGLFCVVMCPVCLLWLHCALSYSSRWWLCCCAYAALCVRRCRSGRTLLAASTGCVAKGLCLNGPALVK
ncbi:hypothetical protein COO60DRAFT_1064961 [Scenedesmus sp. NREL 46B-D3]|nr:hypothetical protein COO60DRAFT_1064961 [Scenedesmus sp. NREL 46B-D3]